jgi:hypothetical protein
MLKISLNISGVFIQWMFGVPDELICENVNENRTTVL